VKAAFTHPEHCIDPLLRKDYVRFMKAVNLRAEVFSKQQRAQLEVYSTLVGSGCAWWWWWWWWGAGGFTV
jgi:hypothetical protein